MLKKINNKDAIIMILIIIFACVNISLIFNDSVWQDEAYTMDMIRGNIDEIISSTAEDVHPPLYYIIVKIFTMIFGYSVPIVKIVSIIPVILIMIFVALKSKKIFKEKYFKISILFILLIGFFPVAFIQNIELRMYTWAMFFVTCSGIYAYELYNKPKSRKNLILFVLTSICAAYTHYYAALTECFIYLFLIVNLIRKYKAWKEVLVIIGITFALYLPWIPIFIKQFLIVKDHWWLQVFDANTILSIIQYLFDGKFTNIFLITCIATIVGMIMHIRVNRKDNEIWFAILCITSFILMVTTGCLVSIILRPVFVHRYMYVGVGLLFLGISIGIAKIEYGKLLLSIFVSVIILNFPFSYNNAYIREYKNGTEDFKEFSKNIEIQENIVTDLKDVYYTLPYYLPNYNLKCTIIDKDTKGYVFTQKTLEKVEEIIDNSSVEQKFSGDIDGSMKFNVYYIK